MTRLVIILVMFYLMILSTSCRFSIPIADAKCDNLTSCLPLEWLRALPTPILETGCDVVTAAPLRELLQDDDLIANASDEIIRRFELTAEELIVETYVGAMDLTWWHLGNRYTLYLQEGRKPLANVFFEKSTPLLKQIVACLDEPESYTSGYRPHELFIFTLGLYFPESGVVAYSTQVTRQENIVFSEDLTATRLMLVPSGTREEMFSYLFFDSSEGAQSTLERLKPWPGSMEMLIETVQADYCLDYPEFCPTDEP